MRGDGDASAASAACDSPVRAERRRGNTHSSRRLRAAAIEVSVEKKRAMSGLMFFLLRFIFYFESKGLVFGRGASGVAGLRLESSRLGASQVSWRRRLFSPTCARRFT